MSAIREVKRIGEDLLNVDKKYRATLLKLEEERDRLNHQLDVAILAAVDVEGRSAPVVVEIAGRKGGYTTVRNIRKKLENNGIEVR